MYFIPRNNVVYNYIAHTSAERRYIATLFTVGAFLVVCFYGIYIPLKGHIAVCKIELARLRKQQEDVEVIDKNSKELLTLVHTSKKNIADRAIEPEKKEEHCHERTAFMLDAITKLGLTLNTYGLCKEKDKGWYTKDSAHCEVTGTIEKIMSLLKTIKESQHMITLSQVAITRLNNDNFQLSCDIGLITIKK